MDKRIVRFFKKHHVFTLATCWDGRPWCASLFYAFLEEEAALIFTSDPVTRHSMEGMRNQKVAGTVAVETELIGLIRGVQFSGVLRQPSEQEEEKVRKVYLKRFPYAVLKGSPLWVIDLYEIKFTNNRLGFGKKLTWSRAL